MSFLASEAHLALIAPQTSKVARRTEASPFASQAAVLRGHQAGKIIGIMTRLERANNVADLRLMARRRLPRPIFDYIDGGADDEVSLRRNATAFAQYELVPDVLNDVSNIRTETRIFGQSSRWPLMLSPTGLTRMFHDRAELAVAGAAARHGLLYSLSTMGTTRLEDLAQAFAGPKVFQIYIFKDRGLTAEFVARCRDAGFHGLALTVDTPVAGNRERDRVSGLSLPPKLTLRSLLSFALHPSWSLPALTGSKFDLANVSHKIDALASGPMSLFNYVGSQFDPSIGWRDVEWLAREWNGPLAIKGVMTPDDARRSIASGATGVMISNHGGRQLDGAPAPVDQIEAVRNAVGDEPDVICDGGIRRGSDIVKALALGATACSIGRPYLYALAAGGQPGVDHLLTLLREEFVRTMMLAGISDIASVSRRHVRNRARGAVQP
ncbi:alpha-hydroxy-acid oxidizing protein [Microvirga sp. SRT01]|uniref:Alpha-hydroxy-acid oxidizing protein n=1 Tax=Sphingomonas longa TaxID=2778730 RepID=A0ABS2DBF5_9SPHN|nr:MULTISPECIES: alpha-hydroxy acid oxidase [Alphaproteobacteria]MBM6578275.1 alpha-hydroxy-acid oxidizing protein [Sphingomonas sp. BT552]MBR7711316.1 alpha-hydroxy-acid oxidizing protein [Microvirga sp. SRT01]